MRSTITYYRGFTLILAQLGLFLAAAPISAKQQQLRRHEAVAARPRRRDEESIDSRRLTCRITVFDTLYERHHGGGNNNNNNDGSLRNDKQICCIPIQEEEEADEEETTSYVESSSDLYHIALPSHILEAHQGAIHEGELLLSLDGAVIQNDTVLLHSKTEYTILDHDSPIATRRRRWRRQLEEGTTKEYDMAFGTRTLKVIRVSTTDSQPSFTAEEMEDRIFHQSIGLASQYEACSFGQLKWESQGGVLEIMVDGDIASYDSGSALRVAAEEKMKQLQIIAESASELADNVMFCLAPGTGDWVANAGTKYWRSQFNDKWCLSLTASMHEVGHNLGLGHSNHNGNAYADETGYMAAAWLDVDWPRKCFNGANHDKLHWFASRTMAFDPITTGPRKIKLATFVDYDKTANVNEPVLLRLANNFVLQYNVAKSFNQDTEQMMNQVTIVQTTPSGTDLRAGISFVGESYKISNFLESEQDVVIEICETTTTTQNNDDNAPEMIIVGIGVFGQSVCGLELYVMSDEEVPGDEEQQSPEKRTPIESTENPPKENTDHPNDDNDNDNDAPALDGEEEEPGSSNSSSDKNDNHRSQPTTTPWKFRETLRGFLFAWETVAKRTTWFEYFIHI